MKSPSPPHQAFEEAEFWRKISAYHQLTPDQFLDPDWQARNSVRSMRQLQDVLGDAAPPELLADFEQGVASATMQTRLTPYTIALVDWSRWKPDPIRRQYLPILSEREPDLSTALDCLGEQNQSPVDGLVQRYPDKALLLATDTCPVYCGFCTRSYAIGPDTFAVKKKNYSMNRNRWDLAIEWLRAHPKIEDVVISGGDAYSLTAKAMASLGESLLSLSSIRRIRIATKGLAVLPSRIGRDRDWTNALLNLVRRGRRQMTSIALHTHINHPSEITWATQEAAELLFQEGVTVRNQSVLLRGINDDAETLITLIRRLGKLQIQPYYMYMADPVPGAEHYRTSLGRAIELERAVRGSTAGFNTPTFVIDLPGGGGKRDIHSYDHYDRSTGESMFSSYIGGQRRQFTYRDPARTLLCDDEFTPTAEPS